MTKKLVELLENYPDEYMWMVGVYPASGGVRLLLADYGESRILFWLKMFDEPKSK
ncbi:hypothetical protein ACQPZ2_32880 [Nocardia pseudovaccinii]|uniref:hypothetical protein n=1 Tax=Nocardia pseudovaccinii TaxID=189540 RepID=UPI003D8E6919